ncbi:MAG: cephalosporin hydroxylase family protein [Candidatus Limnocylindria bacterium]
MKPFDEEVEARIADLRANAALRRAADDFIRESTRPKYSYNFSWLGRPIIQYPQDIVAMQELVWSVQPDLIVETGIAHGGSLILWSSLLELNAACGGPQDGRVVGVDIDIRAHNRAAIEAHPLARRITMIEGSSVDPAVVAQVKDAAASRDRVLVCLDSNHTHAHVLAELEAYAPMTSVGSYCVVFDTVIEDLPEGMYPDRPWGPGDNPKTAVVEYLGSHPQFEVDRRIEDKLLISVAPGGYLRRVR